MNKWLELAQAFQNCGCKTALACECIGGFQDGRYDELYTPYVLLLRVMAATLRLISNRIDEINKEKQNG